MEVAEKVKHTEKKNISSNFTNNNKKIISLLIAIIIILIIMFAVMAVRLGRIGYRNGDLKEVSNSALNMINIINITNEDIEKGSNSHLGIFRTNKDTGAKTIEPGSNGTYKFCVQNTTDDDIKYDINFSDLMTEKINMKYRLKIDNIYIKGDENNYVDISKLNVQEIRVLRNSNNMFTLEWIWDDENDKQDTYVGSLDKNVYYTLNLQVIATRIGI